ncbi:MAG: F0F1 ATP synthase subunit B [Legionellales bacterium RIFCSPHIGHO2_12_FULL_35_11]|nr:MAG: F0F1 ATP synthase subunit B [Legionellales bacterium RIFCSPHIGHO2_12_FULL_35_11]
MDINLTLVVQMLVFLTFVWFTMKFVWPPLEKVLEERRTKIAEGLAAAERSRRELELTQHRISEDLKLARAKSAEIIEKASFRAAQLVEEAKEEAVRQSEHIAKVAQEHLQQEVNRARDNLRKDIGKLAVAGAERILMREINEEVNKALIDNLLKEI